MNLAATEIYPLLSRAELRKIITYQGFYFEKARAVFQAFARLHTDDLPEVCEELLHRLQQDPAGAHQLLASCQPDSTAWRLLSLIAKLVVYLDASLAKKLKGNAYADNRNLGATHLQYHHWIKQLLRYKQYGHQLSAITSPVIRHALQFLDNPGQASGILSEKHRRLIARYVFRQPYDASAFDAQLKQQFEGLSIPLKVEENRMYLLSRLLYTPEWRRQWLDKERKSREEAEPTHAREILEHIHAYINGKGFFFSKQDIANYYLSLKTKPFVILAGISGTGKTQLARQFAAAIGARDRCLLLPVRPDWTDNSDLLGFHDLQGNFREKPLLTFMRRAASEPDKSFFFILDEMNLARVEHYFSDLLSLMETRRREGKQIVTDPIHEGMGIPPNLCFIGTVNMDETTHPFSRKVLDRANAIEMNEVQLDWIANMEEIEPLRHVSSAFLATPFLHARDLTPADRERLQASMVMLMQLNGILKQADLHFGYRVRDEIAFYLLNRYEIREAISENEALDFQIMQKILPRIHGSSRRIGTVIVDLIRLLARLPDLHAGMYLDEIEQRIAQSKNRFYPKAVAKLLFMYRRLEEDGFTSFWI
ncbi:MAG: hypothetical protein D6730_11120 [Bacteroidetes bacterium]|nr:MAG: hypothetical protein D6730_11120 [Bacteroidota bacterium]